MAITWIIDIGNFVNMMTNDELLYDFVSATKVYMDYINISLALTIDYCQHLFNTVVP